MSNYINENKKNNSKKKRSFIYLFLIIAFLIILALSLILVDNYEVCETWDCFNENLALCSRTKFAGGNDIIFRYTIEGEKDNRCKVNVEFVQGNVGGKRTKDLEGKKMTCFTEKGIISSPESDLSSCSGELKEELLEEIVNQLHNYIVQNIGQIKNELLNPLP